MLFVKYFIHKLPRCEFIQLRKSQRGVFQNHGVCGQAFPFLASPPPPRSFHQCCARPNFRAAKKQKCSNGRKNLRKRLLRRLNINYITLLYIFLTSNDNFAMFLQRFFFNILRSFSCLSLVFDYFKSVNLGDTRVSSKSFTLNQRSNLFSFKTVYNDFSSGLFHFYDLYTPKVISG